ncbi:hypothetical protein GJT83_01315 [Enterobacteriaceae endosymbiont of Plateumaris pusilla]|uniref:class I adenylate cyclase n=1 Tax=Enterobacteriaceae endosymbiont of Plateumaris pusilla TaxID=2675795 RepID=UPI001448EAFE|nr:class I adenylate cyclase [Enterobacteriaceae endosymbiont of Plateumaris pusilla]QJC29544.1 hypothetical protein GJT83_01315 [Enterobacteriaceae endosymbiont of Plateumaris pusilla]
MKTNFYFCIEKIIKRINILNQLRINRAINSMNYVFKKIYVLLPILLHYNHPLIPGYISDDVPHGIDNFYPNKKYLSLLTINSIFFKKKYSKYNNPITGIYSMGSISSICQNKNSDFDIWVFRKIWLSKKKCLFLKKKFLLLEQWCNLIGVEVNFFLIDENYFLKNNFLVQKSSINTINKNLLLDEFYRTAVCMAGKPIIWNIIPINKEKYYDDYVNFLYKKKILIKNEWLDLGKLKNISINKYLKSILWHFYNKMDLYPYKTILKILLLESYLYEYPNIILLAIDLKKCLHNGNIISFGLDPYCMMLKKITVYLKNIGNFQQLDLVRQCFYIKTNEKLSINKNIYNWKHSIISILVKNWRWNKKKITYLDNVKDKIIKYKILKNFFKNINYFLYKI